MRTAIIIYGIGALAFFVYICFDEVKSFVGEYKHSLFLGLVASLFWPLFAMAFLVGGFKDHIDQRRSKS